MQPGYEKPFDIMDQGFLLYAINEAEKRKNGCPYDYILHFNEDSFST